MNRRTIALWFGFFLMIPVASWGQQPQPDEEPELLKLARKKFSNLTNAEEKLIRAVAAGESADFRSWVPGSNDPAKAYNWTEKRYLLPRCIEWLCTDKKAQEHVTRNGISIQGARIVGSLNLFDARIPFPVYLLHCQVMMNINLTSARIPKLSLMGTEITVLTASGLQVESSLHLSDGFTALGEVDLKKADIGMDFNCTGGKFRNVLGDAIVADGMRVKGDVYFSNGFESNGTVRLVGATFGGDLQCGGGKFLNSYGSALMADGVRVGGDVLLRNGAELSGEVRLRGATIEGELDCRGGKFLFDKGVALQANFVDVKGNAFLNEGFESKGQVSFFGAVIGGNFFCIGGKFRYVLGDSISADGIRVKGGVYFSEGFESNGTVSLAGATIGGDLACSRGKFLKSDGFALIADSAQVGGNVFLREGAEMRGEVSLRSATIGRDLDCQGSKFLFDTGVALHADGLNVKGNVFLKGGFYSEGQVRFVNAVIGGELNCRNGEFLHESVALNATGARVEGNVVLDMGFKASGQVSFVSSVIGMDLDCSGGKFEYEKGAAILADKLDVKGGVYFGDGFEAKGTVSLVDATIGSNLECNGGKFLCERDYSFRGDSLNVQGSALFGPGFESRGVVGMQGATIGDNLQCFGSKFLNDRGYNLDLQSITIDGNALLSSQAEFHGIVSFTNGSIRGFLLLQGIAKSDTYALSLSYTKLGTLWDDPNSWPKPGNLFLYGFDYREIDNDSPVDGASRLDWIRRQYRHAPEGFRRIKEDMQEAQFKFGPQPYEQLASVLKKQGHVEDAREILIAKEDDRDLHRKGEMSWLVRVWRKVLKHTISYGYEPWQVWPYVVGFIALGTVLFRIGAWLGVMGPVNERAYLPEGGELDDDDGLSPNPAGHQNSAPVLRRISGDYPKFSAFLYSLDEFAPIINLRQGDYWIPNVNKDKLKWHDVYGPDRRIFCWILRVYLRLHILAGWALSTLLVASLTGLVLK
ncbi:MAG: hypothetical protein AABZ47_02260 [Planctomycetota bacterium]